MQGRARAPSAAPLGRHGVAEGGGKHHGGRRDLMAPSTRRRAGGPRPATKAECRAPPCDMAEVAHKQPDTRALGPQSCDCDTCRVLSGANRGRRDDPEVHVDLAPRAELAVPHRGRRSPCRPGPWTRTLRVDAPLPAPGTRRAPTLESIQPTAAAGSCGARPRPGSAPDLHPFARRDPHPFGRPVRSGAEEGAAHGSSQD